MEVVKSLIQSEKDGTLSFGDFSLKEKQILSMTEIYIRLSLLTRLPD